MIKRILAFLLAVCLVVSLPVAAGAAEVTSGTSATTFSPFNLTERCQAVTFLYRAYN